MDLLTNDAILAFYEFIYTFEGVESSGHILTSMQHMWHRSQMDFELTAHPKTKNGLDKI